MDDTRRRRKLLVASVGVATVSYAILTTACGKEPTPVTGNLPAPPPPDAAAQPISGNLPAPPPTDTPIAVSPEGGATTPLADGGGRPSPVSGNLPAPPPPVADGGGRPSPVSGNLPAPPPRKDGGR